MLLTWLTSGREAIFDSLLLSISYCLITNELLSILRCINSAYPFVFVSSSARNYSTTYSEFKLDDFSWLELDTTRTLRGSLFTLSLFFDLKDESWTFFDLKEESSLAR